MFLMVEVPKVFKVPEMPKAKLKIDHYLPDAGGDNLLFTI
jgi:hypothetical protein